MTTTTAMEKAQQHLDKRGKVSKAGALKQMLERARGEIAAALPKHMSPERMIRIAYSVSNRTPALLECDQISMVRAVIEASELGLEPNGILGYAYLVPFKNNKTGRKEVQLQIGYRGYLELAYRSGKVKSICAEVVYDGDTFEWCRGTDQFIRHSYGLRDRGGAPVGAYAIVHFADGGYDFEVLSLKEIDLARSASKAGDYGPWKTHWDAMAKKTAIRRLAKRLPMSPELSGAAVEDEEREYGRDPMPIDLTVADETEVAEEQVDPTTGEVTNARD